MHNSLASADAHIETVPVDTTELQNNGTEHHHTSGSRETVDAQATTRLPFEVLAHIFQLYVDDEAGSPYTRVLGALPLGAICRTWRHVAWTTPRLWSSLRFCLRKTATERHIQLAIDCICRSGQCPLTVDIDVSHGLSESLYVPLVDAVNQALPRCRSIRVSNLTSSTLSRLFLPPNAASSLKTLEINDCDLTSSFDPGTPTLSVLKVGNMDLEFINVNWSALTQFHGTNICSNTVYHALRRAPQITRCHLLNISAPDVAAPRTPFRLPNLQDLYISTESYDLDGHEISFFFKNATLPSLHKCRVQNIDAFQTQTFLNFCLRSSCTLTELSIDEESISGKNLIRIAQALPSLTSLSLLRNKAIASVAGHGPLWYFYYALCLDDKVEPSSDKPVLLPNLQQLTIHAHSPFPWDVIPGFKDRYICAEDGACTVHPGRPSLTSISIAFDYYDPRYPSMAPYTKVASYVYTPSSLDEVPWHLIRDWDLFAALLALGEEVGLDLGIETNGVESIDLFVVSYRTLLQFGAIVGEPPGRVREYMERTMAGELGVDVWCVNMFFESFFEPVWLMVFLAELTLMMIVGHLL